MANTFNAITSGTGGIATTGDASGAFSFTKDGGSAEVYIDASGNVGIGTSSPSAPLDVVSNSGSTGVNIRGRASDNFGSLYFTSNASIATEYAFIQARPTVTYFYTVGSNPLALGTNSTERMRIDSSGNVLVGTTAEISGSGTSDWGVNLIRNSDTGFIKTKNKNTAASYAALFYNANGAVGNITTNASATAYNTSSDYRLKENVQPMVGALDTIAQLKPVTYNWIADGSEGQGFIAHELQAVVPDCVTGEKDAVDADGNPIYQGIDTSFLVATLTAAIQELKAIIDTQAERISVLENKQ